MKLKKSGGRINERRIGALVRLESKLTAHETRLKGLEKIKDKIPDEQRAETEDVITTSIKRIKAEMAVLNSRIVTEDVARSTRTKKKK